jgi:hypothetical protein
VWGIQIGKQHADKVTAMLQDEWEDDATASTAATTCCDSDMEAESRDEDAFDEENRYRSPPSVPMYGGQGASKRNETCDRANVVVKNGQKKRAAKTTMREKSKRSKRCADDATRKPTAQSSYVENEARKRQMEKARAKPASHATQVDETAVDEEPRAEPAADTTYVEKHAFHMGHDAEQTAPTKIADEQTAERLREPRHWMKLQPSKASECEKEIAKVRLAEELDGEEAKKPITIKGLMSPRMRAQEHPAAPLLKEYASQGCPVDVGRDWTLEELEAAVEKGPHSSALEADAIKQIQLEAREKEKQGFAKIYKWKWLKEHLSQHPQLKLSPLAMIPHKSRKYRAILDLSYCLWVAGYLLPSVNDATKQCAPEEAIAQIGTVLPRIIEALARADPNNGPVMMMKVDLKDGFWRIMCQEGQEWNFGYVLPNHPGQPVEIVVPAALQMGWALSPFFFCAASETARDVGESLVREPVGTLPEHPQENLTMPKPVALPKIDTERNGRDFLHMLEAFVDDFIQLAQTTNEEALRHCSRAVLHAIHSVFPPPNVTGHNGDDPVSLKKLMEGEGVWEVRKEILGWIMDGATMCIELSEKKRETMLKELKDVLRSRRGVPFKRFERLVGKLRHASIGIPAGKYLFGPINQLTAIHPKVIYWKRAPAAQRALSDWSTLIREATKEPTHVKELVVGDASYKGTLDASGEGAGGVWLSGTKPLAPTVWRVKWPKEVTDQLITEDNPTGTITNSDLEMAAELLGWLVLEALKRLRHEHVGLCSDNSPTVAWQMRGASKRSAVANRLLRVLAVRMRRCRASPLVTRHLAGRRNHLGDMPSRSFGYKKEWHFEDDKKILTYFNNMFPLPQQNSWTGFRLKNAVAMKVTRELLTQGSSMAEWRRLPRLGEKYGKTGKPTADITECLRTWTSVVLKKWPELRSTSVESYDRDDDETKKPSALVTWRQESAVSPRKSVWTGARAPSTR